MSTHDHTAPICSVSSQQQYPANVQFAATGQWFNIVRTVEPNGVVLLSIKSYARNEQIPYVEESR